MVSVDELLGGTRYKDVDVVTVTPTSMSARVDGQLVEIDLESNPEVNRDIQNLYNSDVKRFRIAQANLESVRVQELDPERTEAWLVVANPNQDVPKAKNLSARQYAAASSVLIPNRATYARGLTDDEILAYPNVCAIITQAVDDGGQSSSRNGARVQYLQEHHSTFLSADPYIHMVQTRSRQVSSTFAVDGKKIIRLVNLLRRPWTSGSATYDAMAFTVETANSTLAPNYLVSEDSKNSLGKIAAAMARDGALAALTATYIYLHRQMVDRFGVSYPTACPTDITPEDTIRRAKNETVPTTLSLEESEMAVIRIPDWNGRCYLVNSLGHNYIPQPAEIPGLLAASNQDQIKEVAFANFLPAVTRINANLEGSVLANLIKKVSPPQAKSAVRTVSSSSQRPDWVEKGLWEEAVARGIQDEFFK